MMWKAMLQQSAGMILLVAFAGKMSNPAAFFDTIRRHGVLPSSFATPLGVAVLLLEASLGVGLVILAPPTAQLELAAGILFLGFSGWAGLALSRQGATDKRLDCGCLGPGLRLRVEWTGVILNGLVGILLVLGAFVNPLAAHELGTASRVVSLLMASLIAGVYWLALYASSIVASVGEAREMNP